MSLLDQVAFNWKPLQPTKPSGPLNAGLCVAKSPSFIFGWLSAEWIDLSVVVGWTGTDSVGRTLSWSGR